MDNEHSSDQVTRHQQIVDTGTAVVQVAKEIDRPWLTDARGHFEQRAEPRTAGIHKQRITLRSEAGRVCPFAPFFEEEIPKQQEHLQPK